MIIIKINIGDMDTIITFITIFLFWYFWQSFFKVPSYQLQIGGCGFRKIPKLLLKLAKIVKDREVAFPDLDKSENEKVMKYYEKLYDVASAHLTFLYNQNLIHIQLIDKSYFYPLDKNQNELVREEVGRIDKETTVDFVLYRKTGGWFNSPILIGYLTKNWDFSYKHTGADRQSEILYEFPEALVRRTFFTKGLESEFNLKKLSDVVDGGKTELGYEEPYWGFTSYGQEHRNGANTNFLIHT